MLVIVLFTSILTACSNKSAEKQLSQAESLIIEQPDSTVAILVYMDTTNMSENQNSTTTIVVPLHTINLWQSASA